jgi:hypothetical protein
LRSEAAEFDPLLFGFLKCTNEGSSKLKAEGWKRETER